MPSSDLETMAERYALEVYPTPDTASGADLDLRVRCALELHAPAFARRYAEMKLLEAADKLQDWADNKIPSEHSWDYGTAAVMLRRRADKESEDAK